METNASSRSSRARKILLGWPVTLATLTLALLFVAGRVSAWHRGARDDSPERWKAHAARVLDRLLGDLEASDEQAAQHPPTAVEVGGRPSEVRGDLRLLRRALRNLIENAVRHGEPPIRIEIADGREPGTVEVVVLDGGPGIPEPWRERIFEPFFRPPGRSSAQGGVGLGLSLVRQIATRHGGRVACEPTPAGKTRFVLTLPRGRA